MRVERLMLCLLLLCTMPAWAAPLHELTWEALIPPDAPHLKPQMTPLHDLAQLGAGMKSAPAAQQQAPHAPVVHALDGQQVKIPGS